MIFAKLILAHLLGDFFLQPKKWVEEKEKKKWLSPRLYYHIIVHFMLILILMWDLSAWPAALFIAGTHYLIDGIKISFQTEKTKAVWFTVDQAAHLCVLIFAWYYFWNGFELQQVGEQFWIVLTAILFLTVPSSVIIQRLMNRWSSEITAGENNSLQNAGMFIGILERLIIFIGVFTGNFQVIGFLLAAKSVFRFGDLTRSENRKLTEYILVGTLLSFLISIITGMLSLRFIA